MKPHRRYFLAYILLSVLLVLLFLLNIRSGSVQMTLGEIVDSLMGRSRDSTIVWNIRLPRILAAAILGGALSVSGFLLQTFFSNPIAGPFVLGISSGAKLTVTITMIACLQAG